MARPLIEIRRLRLHRALQRRTEAHARSVATRRSLKRMGLMTLECVASSLERRGYRDEARSRDRGAANAA